jgi:ATP-dependent DNA helicase RecG
MGKRIAWRAVGGAGSGELTMTVTVEDLEELLACEEGEHLEFKEARTGYHFGRLAKHCAALANEGGGKVILGITDGRPRQIVGTKAFQQPEQTRRGLMDSLHIPVGFTELAHPQGRVLVFEVPPRSVGVPVKCEGVYWAREGDSLVAMSEDQLRAIFAESGHDFSGDVCGGASMDDLLPEAIDDFRGRWITKSGNPSLANLPAEQLLRDAEAVVPEGLTYAALVLFGSRPALGKHLGQAELVFEYRASDASGPAQQRQEYRRGFFSFYDALWTAINLRNETQHYEHGLFVFDVPTFAERSVREAVLNAVSHRDYQLAGSVFVRQYPRRLVVESPGGLPVGIDLTNILDRQSPRNRRIADIFAKCGLVERSGQGMNLMFEQSIQQGKDVPDFSGTDRYQVVVTLNGEVQEPRFLQFLEKVGRERLEGFSTPDFLVLDLARREEPIPERLTSTARRLASLGILETVGSGRRRRFLLSRKLYRFLGTPGVYTRKRGLDRETNKQLLLRHITGSGAEGCPMAELTEVLPSLTEAQVRYRLQLLRREGKVRTEGRGRGARWYLANPDS